jgi:hypothetical protein
MCGSSLKEYGRGELKLTYTYMQVLTYILAGARLY